MSAVCGVGNSSGRRSSLGSTGHGRGFGGLVTVGFGEPVDGRADDVPVDGRADGVPAGRTAGSAVLAGSGETGGLGGASV